MTVRTYSRTVRPSRDGSTPTPAARSLAQQCEWLKLEMRAEARALNDWTDEKTWEFKLSEKAPVTIAATVRGVKESK